MLPSKISKYHIFIFLTILYASFIFYLSSLSDPTTFVSGVAEIQFIQDLGDFLKAHEMRFVLDYIKYSYANMDKIIHMFLYFGLGILLHLAFRNSNNKTLKHYAPVFAIVIGILYGITDEIHQSFVPGRSANILDLLANGIGVVIAQIIFWIAVFKSILLQKEKRFGEFYCKCIKYLKDLFLRHQ